MKKYWISAMVLLIFFSLSTCSTTRYVKPLKPGEHRAGLSVGGPLFDNLGFPIPVPNLSLDYQYGLAQNLGVGGGVYLTPIFFGLGGMVELDIAYTVLLQKGLIPNLTFNGVFHFLFSSKDFRFYPEIGIISSWQLAPGILAYTGIAAFIDFFPLTEGMGEKYPILPIIPVGCQLTIRRLAIMAELQYHMPIGTSLGRVVHFNGISGQGALAPYLGISWSFGAGI